LIPPGPIIPILGATNSTLDGSNILVFNDSPFAYAYFVRVTNFFGSVKSLEVLLLDGINPRPDAAAGGTLRFDLSGDQPRLQFGGVPGQEYLIEASTNLVDWSVIGTAEDLGDGNFEFVDPEWADYDRCYYRIVVP